jgi:hypothetical protein
VALESGLTDNSKTCQSDDVLNESVGDESMNANKKPYQRPELFLLAAGESAAHKAKIGALEFKLCNTLIRAGNSSINKTIFSGNCPQGTQGDYGVAS